MQALDCQNCQTQLASDYQFCPNCGQTTDTHRFTMSHFLHETGHAFTHADKGVFFLIKELAIHPGRVLREYIVEGKRKRYFNPFTFMLLMSGLLLFCSVLLKPYDTELAGMTKDEAKQYTAQIPKGQLILEKQKKFAAFFEQNAKLVSLASVPLTAFIFWVFFRKRGLYFAEHLVAALFLTGFFTIFNILIMPALVYTKGTVLYRNISLLPLFFQVIYFGWAYYPFVNQDGQPSKWKAYFVSLVNVIVWFFLWMVIGIIYMVSAL